MFREEMTIDVAICTRDRLPLLKTTLAALQEATRSRSSVRFLIVDNGSRDGTAAYLGEMAALDPRIVPIQEPRPGLYHARVAAIRQLQGGLLVFVDDDVLPAPDFLDRFEQLFADRSVGAAGGSIAGLYDGPLPHWFPKRLMSSLPVLPVEGAVEFCSYPHYPPGACLALRRDPCLDHYLSPERGQAELGVGGGAISGQPWVGGDDTDLCEIYARAGFRILRVADVRVHHRVHTHRLTPEWIMEKFMSEGRLRVRLARLRSRPGICRETLPMLVAWPALAMLRPFADWFGARRAVLVRAYLAKSHGAWCELLSGRRDIRFSYPQASAAPLETVGEQQ